MTDDHHTPEGADGLRNQVERLVGTAVLKNDKNYTNDIMALFAAEVHASNRRLLDAVEGVIGEDEPAAQLEGSEARHRIAQSAEQIKRDERNSVRAELRAALKGLREGNDG